MAASFAIYRNRAPLNAGVLAILFAVFSTAALAADAPRAVKLRLGDKDVPLKPAAVYDGVEVYLPLPALQALGASYTLTRHEDTANVRSTAGQTLEVALARPGGAPMLPFSVL